MNIASKGTHPNAKTSPWVWLRNWPWRLNFFLGRLLFADMDPLSHHLRSIFFMWRVRFKAGWKPRGDVLFSAKEFERHGYVLLKETYPPDLVQRIQEKATAALAKPESRLPRQHAAPDGNHYSWYVKDLATVAPEVRELLTDELIAAVEHHYRSHLRVYVAKCYRNDPVPEDTYAQRELHSNHWHFDHHRAVGLIKVFYLVNDVTDEDGPLCLQPRPRTLDLMRNGFGDRDDYRLSKSVMEDPEQVFKLTGPAGTAVVCDTTVCLHRAGKVAPGRHRDIIQFHLMPSNAPLSKNWFEDPKVTHLSDVLLGLHEYSTRPTAERRR
jgi:hypothetical protein